MRLFIFCLNLLPAIFSCSLNKKAIEKDNYLLEAKRPQQEVASTVKYDGILKIRQVRINPVFDHRSLVYRMKENKYKVDFYNEYLIDPSAMFAEQFRLWFSQSELFPRIAFYRGNSGACFFMDVLVEEFFYDFSQKDQSKAVLSMTFRLDQTLQKKDIYYRNIKKEMPLKNGEVSSLIAAQSQLLQQILESLEADLRQVPVTSCEKF